MENSEPKEQLPPCNIDIKRPDKTHITAWKDRSEFQAVYDKIFHAPADDIESKEDAVKWLNVWKVRQNREIPICIRCTLVVLEALLFDLRSQRDDRENTTETKNIYAGAFTRFINFLTEGPQNFRWRKTSIAQHVRGIGIETYLVELRHLCAHRSISVSIDVFRRSAQYCMDWLQASYWDRELSTMHPVTILTIKCKEQLAKLPELTTTLRTYDVATAGRAMGFATVSQVKDKLKPDELELLQGLPSEKLKVISSLMLQRLREHLALPRNSVGVNALCNGILTNCKRMMMAPVYREGFTSQKQIGPLGAIHSELFQYLASVGCLQPFFERLIAICEDEGERDEQREAAKEWAYRIGMGFQFLWMFKQYAKSLPPDRLVRFHETSKQKLARSIFQEWFQRTLLLGTKVHPVLGFTVDCPWQLKLSAAYMRNRLAAANSYTRDIIPIMLSSTQPALHESQRQSIEKMVVIYIKQGKINDSMDVGEPSDKTIPKRTANPKAPVAGKESEKIYTKEDIFKAFGTKRRANDPVEEQEPGRSKIKRSGPWSESQEAIAWERCPLGTYHVPAKESGCSFTN